MAVRVRDHVPAATALLTVVSIALVFGAALGYLPAGALPRAPPGVIEAIPHVNAGLSVLALGSIAAGWRWARRGEVAKHRAAMGTAFVLFLAFLGLYLYKVILEGPAAFPGPEPVYRFVYLPLLAIHVLLAIVCLPLLYYVLLLAATRSVPELRTSPHPRVGRIAASLWAISFALGIVVYLLLYVVY